MEKGGGMDSFVLDAHLIHLPANNSNHNFH